MTNWNERVGVHILTRNRPDYLALLLDSLRRQTFKNWDLIIVDNNDDQNMIHQYHPIQAALSRIHSEKHKVTIIRNEKKQDDIGYCRNIPIQHDKNPFGCRIDDDSICDEHYLEELHKVIVSDPKIGAVGGIVPAYMGPRYYRTPPCIFNTIKKGKVLDKFQAVFEEGEEYWDIIDDGGYHYNPNAIIPSHHLRSSFMYRNKAIEGLHPHGYGDTGFREETITCIELLDMGYKLLTNTAAICYHLWAPNLGRGTDPQLQHIKVLRNEREFQRKYRELLNKLFGGIKND